MNNKQNSTIPTKAMDTGTVLVAIGITLTIVVISMVLVVVELQQWRQVQKEINSPSLIKTILVRQ